MSGHAIEARLYAEDPAKGFLPSIGPIVAFETPELEGLRVDAGVEKGSVISPFYNSMIAKLIASGPDRDAAIARLARALEETVVAGPKTNAAFLHALRHASGFQQRRDGHRADRARARQLAPAAVNAAAIAFGVMHMLWHAHDDVEVQRAGSRRAAIRRGARRTPSSSAGRAASS